MSEETGRQSKTLVRGLSNLNAFSSSRSGLTLVELADTTDFAPSTVHRFLAILEAQAFFINRSRNWSLANWCFWLSDR